MGYSSADFILHINRHCLFTKLVLLLVIVFATRPNFAQFLRVGTQKNSGRIKLLRQVFPDGGNTWVQFCSELAKLNQNTVSKQQAERRQRRSIDSSSPTKPPIQINNNNNISLLLLLLYLEPSTQTLFPCCPCLIHTQQQQTTHHAHFSFINYYIYQSMSSSSLYGQQSSGVKFH